MNNQPSDQPDAARILDVRPDLERGDEPFNRIMEAAQATQPGGALVIIAPFEPAPLYGVLGACGFQHETMQVAGDEWQVRFTRGAGADATAATASR